MYFRRIALQTFGVSRMPRVYQRKTARGTTYNEEALKRAIEAVKKQELGVRAASREYHIPLRTLVRRMQLNKTTIGPLGPQSELGVDAELKLVTHIKKLQQRGFAPGRRDVQEIAFNLAEKLGKKHKFNKELGRAGTHWFLSFMERHKDLSIRKAEGMSGNRARGMNREEVNKYFELLESILLENKLFDKPGQLFNMDESGLQLNNKPSKVVAAKGSRDVHVITSSEKGETVTVVACCNAEGNFLPPYCIFKGTYKKPEFEDNMPPGSKVVMCPKSAYMNSGLFYDWVKFHFLPRKPPGKVVIILDGHTSHLNDTDTLEFALSNNIELLCLPSHCTHYLQPLDRAFFRSLKLYFNQATNQWMKTKDRIIISRLSFGALLNEAWIQSATVKNGVSGFRATGIYPYCPSAIPDYAFILSDHVAAENSNLANEAATSNPVASVPDIGLSQHCNPEVLLDEASTENASNSVVFNSVVHRPVQPCLFPHDHTSAGPSREVQDGDKPTPSKILHQISPIPTLPEKKTKRSKQNACHITTKDYICNKKEKCKNSKERKIKKQETTQVATRNTKHEKITKRKLVYETESENEEDEDCVCIICLAPFSQSKPGEEWIQCQECKKWAHTKCANSPDKFYTCINCYSDFDD